MIPTWDIDDAVSEIQYIAGKGFAAAMMPLVGTPAWNDPQYEPLWDAISDTGIAVVMHQGTGQGATGGGVVYRGPGSPGANILTAQTQAPRTTSLLAGAGVFHRHPEMHVVLVEVNGGWLAWCMEVLDELSRHIHCTFQNDPVAIANLPLTGPRTLMWGNDYPHDEGTYPRSQEVIANLFANVSEQDRRMILTQNTAEVFGFDQSILTTPVEASS
jgi:predicted TIM-barrel fold metal-dependent hydrolase